MIESYVQSHTLRKRNWVAPAILAWICGSDSVLASGETPLFWKSVHIRTADRGGAELSAATGDNGALERLELSIRGREIAIPPRCLSGLVRPYLNGVSISYSQSAVGDSYWSLAIPYDGTESVELESTFNLVFSDEALLWSYQSIQIDDRTWEDRDVCPLSPDK